MMRCGAYLAAGLPIASGVLEGACRHLLQDRIDLSAATWTVRNAEAVLKLPALKTSGDFDDYRAFHEQEEFRRTHLPRFKDNRLPPALSTAIPAGYHLDRAGFEGVGASSSLRNH